MISLKKEGAFLFNGTEVVCAEEKDTIKARCLSAVGRVLSPEEARENTIAYGILRNHSTSDNKDKMTIRFDGLASHDITYVGIIQTARASGLSEFPVPYAMTNCHNSLCAVGGTINEDDHAFGFSAAKKYGGIFVPPNIAVIHSYVREVMTGCGRMLLGSDSHTRYGALGTMGVGEGGPEIVKQLLKNTYDIDCPEVVMVYLEGVPRPGVGPHDVAIALVKATFKSSFVKNKVLEFVGPGVSNLSADFRNGIDVMTTETTCLSSIWRTDDVIKRFYEIHGRPGDYKELTPGKAAYYDSVIKIDLSKIECMIALPFHPSNALPINEFLDSPETVISGIEKEADELFKGKVSYSLKSKIKDGGFMVDQGIIAGCAGGNFESIVTAAAIIEGSPSDCGYFSLSVYPGSMPINLALSKNGVLQKLMQTGAVIKPAFCGPCFGAGDVPLNGGFSIRHTTRNFPNREGSKPSDGQISGVALMDALSIAATAKNGGMLTAATQVDIPECDLRYEFDKKPYERRVYNGYQKADTSVPLRYGPNIADWPLIHPLSDNMLLFIASVIHDPVTTTDELIPSGETSSYRSNPKKLAQFTLSRRDPDYVKRSEAVLETEGRRRVGESVPELEKVFKALSKFGGTEKLMKTTSFGSVIFARKPGDGSAREQAASCQRVLGGHANIAYEYATKRYRSNCINWGMIPFTTDESFEYQNGDYIFVPEIKEKIEKNVQKIPAKVITQDREVFDITLYCKGLTENERQIILDGCLINYYARQN